MKKIFTFILAVFVAVSAFAQVDTTAVNRDSVDVVYGSADELDWNQVLGTKDFEMLDSVSIVSFYRNDVNVGSLLTHDNLVFENHGQEPSHIFKKMPNIFSMNDNGTDFGYGYFRIRGLDQTRINVTLDGMPWNEAEDYGTYFANSPDLLSSLQSVKVERGTSSLSTGIAASGGSISLESIDLLADNPSYAYLGGGSFNTFKASAVYNSGTFGRSAVHVKATHQQTAGYKDYGFNKSDAFTLKYGWFIDDYSSLDFITLNGCHRNGQGWLGNTMDELATNPRANGNVKEDDDCWLQSINKLNYKIWFTESVLFNASAFLQYQTGWYNMDLDNYMNRMVDPMWGNLTGMRYSYGLTHYLYGGSVTVSEYNDDFFTFRSGLTYYRYQREHFMDERVSSHFANIPVEEYYDNFGYKNDAEFFMSMNFNLDKFNIGLNGQYRYVDFSYRDVLSNANYSAEELGTKWNFVNYGANVEYNPNNSNKIYVRFASANREPTRTDMFGGNEFYPGELTTTKAERSYDVEAGYVTVGDKIEANLNLYYMYFKNERILNGQYGLNGLPLHDTADNSYRTGVELSLDWNFAGGFHYAINGSASKNIVNSEHFKNKNHILTPSFTLNNDIYYKNSNMKIGLNNIYHSKMYLDQNNTYEIPYYLTFNFYGNYRIKNWEFGARVNNLLNRANYFNAAEGATDLLWFRDAGINFFVDLKFYF